MKNKIFLVFAILGLIVPYIPYYHLIKFNQVNFTDLLIQTLQAKLITFLNFDVIVLLICLILFIIFDKRIKMKWIPITGAFIFGAAFGLPIALYLRTWD